MNKFFKILILFSIILFILAFIVHFVNNKLYDKVSISNTADTIYTKYTLFQISPTSLSHMSKINNIYYEKILTYDKYVTYKNTYNSLVDMSSSDFDTNFLIVLAVENTSMKHLIPQTPYKENNTLYIGLFRDNNENINFNAISIIVPANLNSDNLEVYKAIQSDIPYNNYINIKALPKEYSLEDAKSDLCYIKSSENTVFNDDVFTNFLTEVNAHQNSFIRTVRYTNENKAYISDIYYDSNKNKFLVCKDYTRTSTDFTYNYYEYSNIEQRKLSFGEETTDYYFLTDEKEEDFPISF